MSRVLVSRLLLALYLGLVTYGVISIIAGPSGIMAAQGLETHSANMKSNLNELLARNHELRSELDALSFDQDRAGREARSLGYLNPGEVEIVIVGQGNHRGGLDPGIAPGVGIVLPYESPPSLSDPQIKFAALIVAIVGLVLIPQPSRQRGGSSWRNRLQKRGLVNPKRTDTMGQMSELN